MLTTKECKEILNQDNLNYSDKEIELIRNWMYQLAEIAISAYEQDESNNEDLNI